MKRLVAPARRDSRGARARRERAAAHPLGNFTINRYSRIEPSGQPPLRPLRPRPRRDPDLPGEAAGRGRGRRTLRDPARPDDRAAPRADRRRPPRRSPRSAACWRSRPARRPAHDAARGRLRRARARADTSTIAYRDTNYPGRIGWKEITVAAAAGARLLSASAPSKSVSSELLAYPKDLLQSPLDVVSAAGRRRARAGRRHAARPPPTERARAARRRAGGRRRRLREPDRPRPPERPGSSPSRSLIAMFWGAAHALSPGHGKSIVAAYLVGSRGTPRHAVFLGMTVTVTHTIGVFALGLVTLSLSAFIVPDQLYPWLNLVSALLIVGVGVSVLRWRVRRVARPRARTRPPSTTATHHGHGHHHHEHDHALEPPPPARDRHLRRDRPVPDRARRPARGDLAPPRRATGSS